MLADVSRQLIFEKELTDHALLNHLHAVLLFGPDGKNIIVNEMAVAYCEANSLDRTTAERFLDGIGPYFLDEHSFGAPGFSTRACHFHDFSPPSSEKIY